jgi:hypothetical protein
MSPEQLDLCRRLVITPGPEWPAISKEEFQSRFPSAVRDGKLNLELLKEASETRNSHELSCSMVVGFNFGFSPEHVDILCDLSYADWHLAHEDIVSALEDIALEYSASSKIIQALHHATQWVPEYLGYDHVRALAVKAIWALGKIGNREAELALEKISRCPNLILKINADRQLERLHKRS